MEVVIAAVQLGRAARNEANCKVRQPAPALYVKGAALSDEASALIEEELNVKKVVFVEDASAFTAYKLKPQMRTLGPKYGKLLGKIGQWLANCDGNACMSAFEKGETVKFELEGTMIELEKDDVLTSLMQKPGYVAESDGAYTVVLDTNLTDELINEGFVREVISKVQTMRKEAGFEVTDRIRLTWQTTEKLEKILENGKADLMRAVLAVEAECACADEGAFVREMKINGENAVLAVSVKN
jgi:isoleucyl-tRNA synthetase